MSGRRMVVVDGTVGLCTAVVWAGGLALLGIEARVVVAVAVAAFFVVTWLLLFFQAATRGR